MDLKGINGQRGRKADVPVTPQSFYVIPETQRKIEMRTSPKLTFRWATAVIPVASKYDGDEIAAKIKAQYPASNLRLPTQRELLLIKGDRSGQFEGTDYWVWTSDPHEELLWTFVLLRLSDGGRASGCPENRFRDRAVLFVEDK
jgi:hypothetical protein